MHDQEMCRLEALRAEMDALAVEQMRFLRRLAREHAAAGLPVPAYAEQLLAEDESAWCSGNGLAENND